MKTAANSPPAQPPSYIIAARRSAVVPHNGAFADLALQDLAVPVISALLNDAGIKANDIDEIIVSNALGAGGNPARIIALAAGLPERVPGLAIDRQCCGGLDALLVADGMIRSGQHDIMIAGGIESYSRRPLRYRTFADGSPPKPYDQAPFTPWPDRDPAMADAAAELSSRLGISRVEQDAWAMESHRKARQSQSWLRQCIVPIDGVEADPFTRTLSQRLCARAPSISGSISSANMCVAADAAAFCLVVSKALYDRLGVPGIAILGGATMGDDPTMPGLAPVAAITHCLAKLSLAPGDLAVAEIMEAFAVQAIACQRGADIDPAIVNPHGGSLARGHPIGASGTILAVHLYHALTNPNMATQAIGLAAIAAAGGLGTALFVKRGSSN